jgi:hypothetical protein
VEGALGLETPVALTRGRNDGSSESIPETVLVSWRERQRFDGDSARGRKRRGGGSKKTISEEVLPVGSKLSARRQPTS